jgi:hypothetical protein
VEGRGEGGRAVVPTAVIARASTRRPARALPVT